MPLRTDACSPGLTVDHFAPQPLPPTAQRTNKPRGRPLASAPPTGPSPSHWWVVAGLQAERGGGGGERKRTEMTSPAHALRHALKTPATLLLLPLLIPFPPPLPPSWPSRVQDLFPPLLQAPHTHAHTPKNCHGVFHQLPTRGSFLGLLPWGTQPTKPRTGAHLVWVPPPLPSPPLNQVYSPPPPPRPPLPSILLMSGRECQNERPTTEELGLGSERVTGAEPRCVVPQDWAEKNSAGHWRRDFFCCFCLFCLFSFRNLVAWFSYLSQYIFTYLLLKWIPLQLMKKIL